MNNAPCRTRNKISIKATIAEDLFKLHFFDDKFSKFSVPPFLPNFRHKLSSTQSIMSSAEPTTSTPTTSDSATTPVPVSASEMNAVPAGDASKEKTSKVPGGSSKGSKPSRKTPSMARTVAAPDREQEEAEQEEKDSEEKEGSGDESEYETICIRRKKPTPILLRLKKFLSTYWAFDVYMTSVMWEAFKIVAVTSQFNWALEIVVGFLHIMVAAGKCALKKQCTASSQQRKRSDSTGSEQQQQQQEKTPEPESKKSSVKGNRSTATGKGSKVATTTTGSPSVPAGTKSPSKAGPGSEEGPTSSEPPTGEASTEATSASP